MQDSSHIVNLVLNKPVKCDIHIEKGRAVVQSLSRVRLFVTPWTAACQASLSFTISGSLLEPPPPPASERRHREEAAGGTPEPAPAQARPAREPPNSPRGGGGAEGLLGSRSSDSEPILLFGRAGGGQARLVQDPAGGPSARTCGSRLCFLQWSRMGVRVGL